MRLRYQPKDDDPYSSHSLILARVGEGRGRRLLDVGAANGMLAERFSERGFEVTCIEGDPALASLARGKCREIIVTDLDGRLPVLTGSFDVIVYGDILEHLKDPLRLLQELNRYLSPAGKVIVSAPNVAHLWVRLNLLCGRFEYAERGILDRTHLHFFTLASFRRLLSDAGLSVSELLATPVPLTLLASERHRGLWLRAAHRLNASLAKAWKTMFGYQFVAVAGPRKRS